MKQVWWRSFNLQIHGKDFLRDFLDECARVDARPMLFWGTLLGHVREDGFILHDYDIDLVLLPRDRPKRRALIAGMRSRGYRIHRDEQWQVSFRRAGRLLHLDVDMLFPTEKQLATINVSDDGAEHVDVFQTEVIGEPKRGVFSGDLPVWLPQNPELVLEAIYGDWRTPRPDYRARDARSRVNINPVLGWRS